MLDTVKIRVSGYITGHLLDLMFSIDKMLIDVVLSSSLTQIAYGKTPMTSVDMDVAVDDQTAFANAPGLGYLCFISGTTPCLRGTQWLV